MALVRREDYPHNRPAGRMKEALKGLKKIV